MRRPTSSEGMVPVISPADGLAHWMVWSGAIWKIASEERCTSERKRASATARACAESVAFTRARCWRMSTSTRSVTMPVTRKGRSVSRPSVHAVHSSGNVAAMIAIGATM